MSKLFDALVDETPPSIGEEIGSALAIAVKDMGKSNEAMASAIAVNLTKAITDALGAVDSKQVVIQKQDVKKWTFKVSYIVLDGMHRPDTITATIG